MKELQTKLENAFSTFDTLQADMEMLLSNRPEEFPGKMDSWINEYRRKAANLQFLLDSYRVAMTHESDLNEVRKWQNRLKTALDRQDRLYELLEKIKRELAYRLKNVKAGKNAITGYHSGKGVDKPVFISRDA